MGIQFESREIMGIILKISEVIIIIIIIILLHYHKGLSAVGLSLPTDSLGLQSIIACVVCPKGVFRLCKAIKKNIQLGAGERGGGTKKVTCV